MLTYVPEYPQQKHGLQVVHIIENRGAVVGTYRLPYTTQVPLVCQYSLTILVLPPNNQLSELTPMKILTHTRTLTHENLNPNPDPNPKPSIGNSDQW